MYLSTSGATQRFQPEYSTDEIRFDEELGLWLFGNARLLEAELFHIAGACGPPVHSGKELDAIEVEAEAAVLDGKVLVCGIHSPAHQRAAVVCFAQVILPRARHGSSSCPAASSTTSARS
jgi:hypothetical protein